MQALLVLIVSWLVVSFGLPAADELPRVALVSPATMADVRDSRLASISRDRAGTERSTATVSVRDVHALYDDRSRTIYLPEGWSAASPADVSLLVHELVHHLQHAGGLTHACPQARERLAYRAQARWLELFGTSLADEFEIDAMTLLARTTCVH